MLTANSMAYFMIIKLFLLLYKVDVALSLMRKP